MNTAIKLTRLLAYIGLGVCVAGLALKVNEIMNRPCKRDLSRPRGHVGRSVLYAFTLGMAPWEKESTRLHWLAYSRGVAFHIGVFAALALFFVSPWLAAVPLVITALSGLVTAVGAVAGFAGIGMRLKEENLRVLSLPDDYASVAVTSVFVLLAFVALLSPVTLPLFYVAAAVMFAYIPVGKIRHCLYFFYSKFFFGKGFGHRGVIHPPASEYAE
jgi:hypothetical protein